MSAEYHAKLSPSSAHRWSSCTASIAAQEGLPNTSSEASRRGTACHLLLEEMLLDASIEPQSYLARALVFEPEGQRWGDENGWNPQRAVVQVDQEIIDIAVTAANYVRERVALTGAEMLVEKAVPIGQFTGEVGATGRTDVTLIYGTTVESVDLKGGRGRVDAYDVIEPATTDMITGKPVPEKVRANLQMACYALGTIEELGLLYDIRDVVMTIVQPAIGHLSTYSCSIDELREVEAFLREKAEETRTNPQYVPSQESCHFCRANGNCKAQTEMVMNLALEGFDTDEPKVRIPGEIELGQAFHLVPLVSAWLKAVGERVYEALHAGKRVARADGVAYKLVEGKKGARAWTDEAAAEDALKKMRLKADQIYTQSLISPTSAEKLAKAPKAKKGEPTLPPVLGPTQWKRLQEHITQDEGKPSIVLETDPRPPIATALDGFGDVPPADNSDLFSET